MAKLAFLGLGVMGYPMAGHLKKKATSDCLQSHARQGGEMGRGIWRTSRADPLRGREGSRFRLRLRRQ